MDFRDGFLNFDCLKYIACTFGDGELASKYLDCTTAPSYDVEYTEDGSYVDYFNVKKLVGLMSISDKLNLQNKDSSARVEGKDDNNSVDKLPVKFSFKSLSNSMLKQSNSNQLEEDVETARTLPKIQEHISELKSGTTDIQLVVDDHKKVAEDMEEGEIPNTESPAKKIDQSNKVETSAVDDRKKKRKPEIMKESRNRDMPHQGRSTDRNRRSSSRSSGSYSRSSSSSSHSSYDSRKRKRYKKSYSRSRSRSYSYGRKVKNYGYYGGYYNRKNSYGKNYKNDYYKRDYDDRYKTDSYRVKSKVQPSKKSSSTRKTKLSGLRSKRQKGHRSSSESSSSDSGDNRATKTKKLPNKKMKLVEENSKKAISKSSTNSKMVKKPSDVNYEENETRVVKQKESAIKNLKNTNVDDNNNNNSYDVNNITSAAMTSTTTSSVTTDSYHLHHQRHHLEDNVQISADSLSRRYYAEKNSIFDQDDNNSDDTHYYHQHLQQQQQHVDGSRLHADGEDYYNDNVRYDDKYANRSIKNVKIDNVDSYKNIKSSTKSKQYSDDDDRNLESSKKSTTISNKDKKISSTKSSEAHRKRDNNNDDDNKDANYSNKNVDDSTQQQQQFSWHDNYSRSENPMHNSNDGDDDDEGYDYENANFWDLDPLLVNSIQMAAGDDDLILTPDKIKELKSTHTNAQPLISSKNYTNSSVNFSTFTSGTNFLNDAAGTFATKDLAGVSTLSKNIDDLCSSNSSTTTVFVNSSAATTTTAAAAAATAIISTTPFPTTTFATADDDNDMIVRQMVDGEQLFGNTCDEDVGETFGNDENDDNGDDNNNNNNNRDDGDDNDCNESEYLKLERMLNINRNVEDDNAAAATSAAAADDAAEDRQMENEMNEDCINEKDDNYNEYSDYGNMENLNDGGGDDDIVNDANDDSIVVQSPYTNYFKDFKETSTIPEGNNNNNDNNNNDDVHDYDNDDDINLDHDKDTSCSAYKTATIDIKHSEISACPVNDRSDTTPQLLASMETSDNNSNDDNNNPETKDLKCKNRYKVGVVKKSSKPKAAVEEKETTSTCHRSILKKDSTHKVAPLLNNNDNNDNNKSIDDVINYCQLALNQALALSKGPAVNNERLNEIVERMMREATSLRECIGASAVPGNNPQQSLHQQPRVTSASTSSSSVSTVKTGKKPENVVNAVNGSLSVETVLATSYLYSPQISPPPPPPPLQQPSSARVQQPHNHLKVNLDHMNVSGGGGGASQHCNKWMEKFQPSGVHGGGSRSSPSDTHLTHRDSEVIPCNTISVEMELRRIMKPMYNRGDITKDQYKDIMKKAVTKICLLKRNLTLHELTDYLQMYIDSVKR
ncbi:hypothetical protein HELRODRAFT_193322 [Helobdella robusta]|uniref:SFR19-like C-terminal domain-containing protein n=1 Tax=Helobdella robusta TaxID=6412 RepID=T1FUV9_HELRO|nr:hypothetical protein HELRODRAFT_193322 [Helobdella robusta]ESN97258.1 hypothetical protein HELRODRAFT_193322 [Helobdella robusta]